MDQHLNDLLDGFKAPQAEFRPQYFWFLNHDMDIAEVTHQLDVMKRSGAGGAFLHARTGRITPYMGEKWLAMATAAIQHGREIGMKVWLYDEDGFPSGYAGGRTVERDPKEHAANFIVLVDEFELKPGEKIDAEIKLEYPTSELFGVVATMVKETGAGGRARRVSSECHRHHSRLSRRTNPMASARTRDIVARPGLCTRMEPGRGERLEQGCHDRVRRGNA